MKTTLKLGLLQQDIIWENSRANMEAVERHLSTVEKDLDLFVLPEMFHCGFTMSPEKVAQTMTGELVTWMKRMAADSQVTLIGSAAIKENGLYYNRLLVVKPNGTIKKYDKRHLFRMGGEHEVYASGKERLIVDIEGWRVLPLICYDLRFPVWCRGHNDFDLLLFVANWPAPRRDVWNTLLKARALENQCYLAGVNRVGNDISNAYAGDSVILDPRGNELKKSKSNKEELIIASLHKNVLEDFRAKFPVWLDADQFTINI